MGRLKARQVEDADLSPSNILKQTQGFDKHREQKEFDYSPIIFKFTLLFAVVLLLVLCGFLVIIFCLSL